MNIYIIKDESQAQDILQLLKLNSECAKLHWSRRISVSSDVINALSTVEMFVETKIKDICGNPINTLSEAEEDAMLDLIRKHPNLRETLGVGVIMRGKQSKNLLSVIKSGDGFDKLIDACNSDSNIVVF